METMSSELMLPTLEEPTDSAMVFRLTLNYDSMDSTYISYIMQYSGIR